MSALELRTKLVEIINSSDERFLHLVNALHKNYENSPTKDFFTELPEEIKELLLESRIQAQQSHSRSHKEVMNDFKKRYNISDKIK